MIQLIKEIRATEGMHLIVSSHLLRDVEECCEQVLILKEGMIMAYLDLEEERKGNRMFLDLETVGLNESFVSGLESLGCECGVFNAGRMKLVLPPQVGIRDLYGEAARHNVQLRKMSYRRDSLEDIFLRSMQGTETDGAGNSATNGASSGGL